MALVQCIIIIALQAAICSQNTLQANILPESPSKLLDSTTNSESKLHLRAKDRLDRIKWENIAFMGFQFWFFSMAVDAVSLTFKSILLNLSYLYPLIQTVYQNTAAILVLAVLNCLCAILGALEIVDGAKWLRLLRDSGEYPTDHLATAEKIEIVLAVVILIFAIIMSYLSYQMSKQFGWNIYKKIGADVRIQSNKYLLSLYIYISNILCRNVSYLSILCIGY